MQYLAAIGAFAALASTLAIRQTPTPEDVDVVLLPSYGCPGSDPIATIDSTFLDGTCHGLGDEFNSTQTTLSGTNGLQQLVLYQDTNCTTPAVTLTNQAGDGFTVADGSCVSAPQGQSFLSLKYDSPPSSS